MVIQIILKAFMASFSTKRWNSFIFCIHNTNCNWQLNVEMNIENVMFYKKKCKQIYSQCA